MNPAPCARIKAGCHCARCAPTVPHSHYAFNKDTHHPGEFIDSHGTSMVDPGCPVAAARPPMPLVRLKARKFEELYNTEGLASGIIYVVDWGGGSALEYIVTTNPGVPGGDFHVYTTESRARWVNEDYVP